jgi:hypothetical protein
MRALAPHLGAPCIKESRGACVQRLAVPSAFVGPDPPTSLAGVRTPRRVSHFDAAIGKRLVFLTNNFALPAPTIA